jgi:hypothetical protein
MSPPSVALVTTALSCYTPAMVISRGLKQAYDVQNFAHEALMAVKAELGNSCLVDKDKAAIIAQLGKVWRDAQEQVRIHRGKPLPGSLTHEKVGAGKRKRKLGAMSSLLSMPLPDAAPSETSASQGQGDERDERAPGQDDQPGANAS